MQNNQQNIMIAGAGSIGFFIGGLLQHAGHKVNFLARKHMIKKISDHGLNLTAYTGLDVTIPAERLDMTEKPEELSEAEIILVTVKSSATEEMAKLISENAKPEATIISLQNGISNSTTLKQILSKHKVLAGMVPFNVAQMDDARFHMGTSGNIIIEEDKENTASMLNSETLPFEASSEIKSVQSGKLLINLNNALNALCGLPLLEQLGNRGWRKIMADQMTEAHHIMKRAGMTPKSPSPVPASFIPHILRLPTPLFKIIAKQMLSIDPLARSSMWEDLEQGRKTEIHELQGAVIDLANKNNLEAPLNQRVLDIIKRAEEDGEGSPHFKPEDI